jgi:hypothetical protein
MMLRKERDRRFGTPETAHRIEDQRQREHLEKSPRKQAAICCE